MSFFFYFVKRKEKFLKLLLPFFFLIFSSTYSYSQKDSAFVYYKKGNIITELLFSFGGFSGKDTSGSSKYYWGFATYSKIGYTVFDKINAGIRADYFFTRSNVVAQEPPFYQVGAYARYYFLVKRKISLFGEGSYVFSNACYLKDTSNVIYNKPKVQYLNAGIGFNFKLSSRFFGNISGEIPLLALNDAACNRRGYTIKLGVNYYFKL